MSINSLDDLFKTIKKHKLKDEIIDNFLEGESK